MTNISSPHCIIALESVRLYFCSDLPSPSILLSRTDSHVRWHTCWLWSYIWLYWILI